MFATAKNYSVGDHPTCQYGTSPGHKTNTASGESWTYTDGGWVGMLHKVVITGLEASTKYYYACSSSAEMSFTTAPPAGHLPVTVGVVADLGENCDKPGCGNATIAALAKATAEAEFGMLVHAGDIAYTGGEQTVWDQFLREMQPIASQIPYMVCVGNHEHYYNFSGYLHRFAMPEPQGLPQSSLPRNLLFSFDFGGTHWVAFSTEHDLKAQVGSQSLWCPNSRLGGLH